VLLLLFGLKHLVAPLFKMREAALEPPCLVPRSIQISLPETGSPESAGRD
jgi:hypothetical protein